MASVREPEIGYIMHLTAPENIGVRGERIDHAVKGRFFPLEAHECPLSTP